MKREKPGLYSITVKSWNGSFTLNGVFSSWREATDHAKEMPARRHHYQLKRLRDATPQEITNRDLQPDTRPPRKSADMSYLGLFVPATFRVETP